MKTLKVLAIVITLIALVALNADAQNYWQVQSQSIPPSIKNTNTGNVGIGSGLTYWNKFAIDGSRKGLWLDGRSNEIQWLASDYGNGLGHRLYTYDFVNNTGITQLRIDARGKISSNWTTIGVIDNAGTFGINNLNPTQRLKLDVNGYLGFSNNDTADYAKFAVSSQQPRGLWLKNYNEIQWLASPWSTGLGLRVYSYDCVDGYGTTQLRFEGRGSNWTPVCVFNNNGKVGIGAGFTPTGTDLVGKFQVNNGQTNLFTVLDNGKVGIGTTNPSHTLSVNGAIRAKEIWVNTNWPDFVFADGYNIRPIAEVEKYIKANKHLPDIPTSTEVRGQGVGLGEMQAKLLQKVEELTIYVVELKKENETLKKRVEALEK